jgi:hypothetical protein
MWPTFQSSRRASRAAHVDEDSDYDWQRLRLSRDLISCSSGQCDYHAWNSDRDSEQREEIVMLYPDQGLSNDSGNDELQRTKDSSAAHHPAPIIRSHGSIAIETLA